ncbi:WXG100 family type VII secretion target [Actinosynnema sp. NPDC059335]|uniref:WXG100-like domain-containing protein n=1 Tax=Actinosynnema sp. NPDC059335 TaxID=3346804 RepID=UPI00366D87C1
MTDTEAGFRLAQEIDRSTRELEQAAWADPGISVKEGALAVLGAIANPAQAALSAGVGWLIEHVEPLREALDELAGDPAAIAAYADAWTGIATRMTEAQQRLAQVVAADTAGWSGEAADAYRAQAREQEGGLAAVAATAANVAAAVRSAGDVIGSVRDMVRDIVAECVGTILSRLPIWLGLVTATAGLALPGILIDLAMLVAEFLL